MFEKKTAILYITRTHAFLYDGMTMNATPFAMTWNGKNIAGLIQLAKQHVKEHEWRLLLGNEYAYILTLHVSKEQANAAYLKQELAGRVPEEVTDDNYAWKAVKTTDHASDITIQAMVIAADFQRALRQACKDHHVTIADSTVLPLVLAQEAKSFPSPQIICWFDQERLCIGSYQGVVSYCESFADTPTTVVQHVTQMAQMKSLNAASLLTNSTLADDVVTALGPTVQVIPHQFQPIAWLLQQSGSTDDLLWFHAGAVHAPAPVTTVTHVSLSPDHAPPEKSSKRMYILLGVLLILLLFTVWYAYTAL